MKTFNWWWYIMFCTACSTTATTATTGPVLNKALNEEIVFIDKKIDKGHGVAPERLETTIFRPDGPGPFPVVIINHGKDYGHPGLQKRNRYIAASQEFVRRGYAVIVPMRSGFSRSSGSYPDTGCDITDMGYKQAEDIRAALVYAQTLPYADPQRILVIGHSLGGLATLALGVNTYPGLRGLVNFAGGIKQPVCEEWEQELLKAFATYGRKNRYPNLWFYGDNDTFWPSSMVTAMHAAYTAGGGKAKLIRFGAFQEDAHALFLREEGVPIWWREMEKFLAARRLPTQHLPTKHD